MVGLQGQRRLAAVHGAGEEDQLSHDATARLIRRPAGRPAPSWRPRDSSPRSSRGRPRSPGSPHADEIDGHPAVLAQAVARRRAGRQAQRVIGRVRQLDRHAGLLGEPKNTKIFLPTLATALSSQGWSSNASGRLSANERHASNRRAHRCRSPERHEEGNQGLGPGQRPVVPHQDRLVGVRPAGQQQGSRCVAGGHDVTDPVRQLGQHRTEPALGDRLLARAHPGDPGQPLRPGGQDVGGRAVLGVDVSGAGLAAQQGDTSSQRRFPLDVDRGTRDRIDHAVVTGDQQQPVWGQGTDELFDQAVDMAELGAPGIGVDTVEVPGVVELAGVDVDEHATVVAQRRHGRADLLPWRVGSGVGRAGHAGPGQPAVGVGARADVADRHTRRRQCGELVGLPLHGRGVEGVRPAQRVEQPVPLHAELVAHHPVRAGGYTRGQRRDARGGRRREAGRQ